MFKCELIGENGIFDREEGFESIKDAFEWASGRGSHYCAYIENSETSELWKGLPGQWQPLKQIQKLGQRNILQKNSFMRAFSMVD